MSPPAPAKGGRPAATVAALLGGVILLSGLIGFAVYRLAAPPRTSLRAVTRDAATETPAPAPPARRIPETVPEVTLPGLDGRTHSLSEWKGRPLLINFWATWCEPCRREIPLLESIRRENDSKSLQIVGIALDNRESVGQFARRLGMNYPVLIGENGGLEAVQAFGMDTVLPFSVFADPTGRIVTLKVGELHADEARLILGDLRDLDRGRLALADAREQIAAGIQRLEATRAVAGTASSR